MNDTLEHDVGFSFIRDQRHKRGCRCDACRAGNREYQRELKARVP